VIKIKIKNIEEIEIKEFESNHIVGFEKIPYIEVYPHGHTFLIGESEIFDFSTNIAYICGEIDVSGKKIRIESIRIIGSCYFIEYTIL